MRRELCLLKAAIFADGRRGSQTLIDVALSCCCRTNLFDNGALKRYTYSYLDGRHYYF